MTPSLHRLLRTTGFLILGLSAALPAISLRDIRLQPGDNFVTAAVLDPAGDTAYFATAESDFRYSLETSSAAILQVRLSDFRVQQRIVLAAGETPLQAAVIDPHYRRAYFGVY